eukprot:Opistho-1_new@3197
MADHRHNILQFIGFNVGNDCFVVTAPTLRIAGNDKFQRARSFRFDMLDRYDQDQMAFPACKARWNDQNRARIVFREPPLRPQSGYVVRLNPIGIELLKI